MRQSKKPSGKLPKVSYDEMHEKLKENDRMQGIGATHSIMHRKMLRESHSMEGKRRMKVTNRGDK